MCREEIDGVLGGGGGGEAEIGLTRTGGDPYYLSNDNHS